MFLNISNALRLNGLVAISIPIDSIASITFNPGCIEIYFKRSCVPPDTNEPMLQLIDNKENRDLLKSFGIEEIK